MDNALSRKIWIVTEKENKSLRQKQQETAGGG